MPLMSKAGLAVCCIALIQIGEFDFSTALVKDDGVSNGVFLEKRGASAHVGENGGGDSLSAAGEGPEGEPLQGGLAFDPSSPAGDDDDDEREPDESLGPVDNLVRRLMGVQSSQAKNQFRQRDELDSADRRLSDAEDLEEGVQEEPRTSGGPGGEDDEDLGLDRLFDDQDMEGVEKSAQRVDDKLLEFLRRFLGQLGAKDVSDEDLKQVVGSALTVFKAMSKDSGTEGAGKDLADRRLSATDDFEEGAQEDAGMFGEPGGEGEEDLGLDRLFDDQDKVGVEKEAEREDDKLLQLLRRFLSHSGAKDVSEEDLKQVVQSALKLFKAMGKESGTEGAGKDVGGGVEGRRLSARTGRQSAKEAKRKSGISERAESSNDSVKDAAAGSVDTQEGGYDEATVRVKAAAGDLVRAIQTLMGGLGDVAREGPIRRVRSAAVDLTEKLALGGQAVKQKTQDATANMTQRLMSLLESAWVTLARANPNLLKLAVEAHREMEKEIGKAVEAEDSFS